MKTQRDLIAVALALLSDAGDGGIGRLTAAEKKVVKGIEACSDAALVADVRGQIQAGQDPLGEAFLVIHTAEERRGKGQIFTPTPMVDAMLARAQTEAAERGNPARIVDPGSATGRFLLQAGRLFPHAVLIGVELDPLCALLLRANLFVAGLADRAEIKVADFRKITLKPVAGWTLYVGNPPYVRHHDIDEAWKTWYGTTMATLGVSGASKLAGLHLHFFAAIGLLAVPGDVGVLVTSAEWLDTGYGRALRALLCGRLGGISIHSIDARAHPFPGTQTTAAITVFQVGRKVDSVRFEAVPSVDMLGSLAGGKKASVKRLGDADRWPPPKCTVAAPAGVRSRGSLVGEWFRVSRGQVTGKNAVWIDGEDHPEVPARLKVPCVTGAEEVFDAYERGEMPLWSLRQVIDLPKDLSTLTNGERLLVERFLRWAQKMGADETYIAQHRTPWWSVKLHPPAPIICTYMARRRPVFVRNRAGARLLNIAHGLYPRRPLTDAELDQACDAMNQAFHLGQGRTYAGGLVKFEPRAVEAVEIPWRPDRQEAA